MDCFIGRTDFRIEEPTVVTIGKFDGRHKGHQKLLGRMLELKRQKGYRAAVFTFDTAPMAKLSGTDQKVITTNQERRNNMAKMGIDYLVEYPFTRDVVHLSAEAFVREILIGKMNARAMVVGTDCGFGYQRSGNAQVLKELSSRYGYELEVIVKEQDEKRDISSTYIKEELAGGRMEKANKLLGEPYAIHGTVVHGNHVGGPVLGFPTVNIIPPEEKFLPPFGVYVSRVVTEDGIFGGITNIGRKPTVERDCAVGVETYIFGLNKDLYGTDIEVQLLNYERPERKFDSLEQLKEQLKRDKEYGLSYLDKEKALC
ncbi:MAG: bifunctional riboflavin kinase/FAD synthetase [Hungatella sp.]|jgi:riboflavin kinase/FMN adenylyltransferase|nr:bifunctional riboflavin kinase/FAD synthetase [Hungatella sp.]